MKSIIDEIKSLPGVRILTLEALSVVGMVAMASLVFFVARCEHPVPVAHKALVHPFRPAPAHTVLATASAEASASTHVRIAIKRRGREKATVLNALEGGQKSSQVSQHPTNLSDDNGDEEIDVAIDQTMVATSTAVVLASESAPVVSDQGDIDRILKSVAGIPRHPAHGRLGVNLGLVPGGLSADLEVVSVDIPPSLFGMPLELGVDLEANPVQFGAGVSAGGKAFMSAGAWSSWKLAKQGFYAVAGLRF